MKYNFVTVCLSVLLSILHVTSALEFIDVTEYNKSATAFVSHHKSSGLESLNVTESSMVKKAKGDGIAFLEISSGNETSTVGGMNNANGTTLSSSAVEDTTTTKSKDSMEFLDLKTPSTNIGRSSLRSATGKEITSPKASGNNNAGVTGGLVIDPSLATMISTKTLNANNTSTNTTESDGTTTTITTTTDMTSNNYNNNNNNNVVLITGITGMVGSSTAKELVLKGKYKIFGLARADSSLQRITNILSNITIIHGDITDSFHMIDIIKEISPDYLLHFAAQSSNSLSFDNPQVTMEVNVHGTLNLLEAIRRNGLFSTKFFYAGSWSEYGRSAEEVDGQLIPETLKLAPVSPFGLSKATAEQLTLQYYHNYGIPVSLIFFPFFH
jgi:hypothetical protein